jgi:hypothetical protein
VGKASILPALPFKLMSIWTWSPKPPAINEHGHEKHLLYEVALKPKLYTYRIQPFARNVDSACRSDLGRNLVWHRGGVPALFSNSRNEIFMCIWRSHEIHQPDIRTNEISERILKIFQARLIKAADFLEFFEIQKEMQEKIKFCWHFESEGSEGPYWVRLFGDGPPGWSDWLSCRNPSIFVKCQQNLELEPVF